MTGYFSKRLGKLLFPHLAHDQRKNQMSIIVLVLMVSLVVAGTMAMVMLRYGRR
jgi:heme/copper-type cytochrome/quinol oxidase subunit 2